jgi:hypothetical protein
MNPTIRRVPSLGRPVLASLAVVLAGLGQAWGGDNPPVSPEAAAFFETSVRPILVEHCLKCHGDKKQSGGLRLDARKPLLEGGDTGPAIVPGEPEKSLLVQAVRHQGELKMPEKEKLPEAAIASIDRWVRMGAPWPEGTIPNEANRDAAAKGHWAYQPVTNPAIPSVKASEAVVSPIDAFVEARLEAKGLTLSPLADKRTLIRRVSFDLTGLPPTAEEVASFLADSSPQAFARLVERLLASPAYGERWGRHWLDVARYADTKGYVFNAERRYPYSYTYRDYVISAFNDDLPFDRFVVEQIAADRLDLGSNPRPLAALGFLTVGRRFLNNNDDIIDDRIDVVSRGLMGLTVTCARCHDHKFDPIPTEDYYSLHGVFASSTEPDSLPLLGTPVREPLRADYERQRQARQATVDRDRARRKLAVEAEIRNHLGALVEAAFALDFKAEHGRVEDAARARQLSPERLRFATRRLGKLFARPGGDAGPVMEPWKLLAALPAEGFEARASELTRGWIQSADKSAKINPTVARSLAEPPVKSLAEVAARYGAILQNAARAFGPNPEVGPPSAIPDEALRPIYDRLLAGGESPLVVPPDQLDRVLNRLEREQVETLEKALDELEVNHPGSPARAMVLADRPDPVNPHVYIRGNPGRPGKSIPRRFLRVLSAGGEAKPFANGSGRLELARAIASPSNPLTPRVLVNRLWHEHFGEGIVTTPSDFGSRGEPPSNPELLDFLAHQFVESGWSIKAMHRLILLSRTYQQTSDSRSDGLEVDPANRLLWRQNRRRLDFESLRDAVLAVSHRLDITPGGRPVELFEGDKSSTRRTIYGMVDRYALDATYRTFDFPSPDISAPKRPSTIVPQQALFLLNSPFLLDQARALAHRQDIEALPSLEKRVDRLHLDLFGRPAEARDQELARRFLDTAPRPSKPEEPTAWELYAQVLLMTNEFTYID